MTGLHRTPTSAAMYRIDIRLESIVLQWKSDSYTYDDNGNTLTRGSGNVILTWNPENRLVSFDGNGQTTTFVYDGDGNRVKKTTPGGDTILYVNKYYEKNLTADNVTTYYYLGDRLMAMSTDNVVKYVHQDHLLRKINQVRLSLNAHGQEVHRAEAE